MHTDENKMNFLRRVLTIDPSMSIQNAFAILSAAVESLPSPPADTDGVQFNGVFFSSAAESFMSEGQRLSAIREVWDDNRGANFGLREAKDAVEARMEFMGW